jgi:hypothetical protein
MANIGPRRALCKQRCYGEWGLGVASPRAVRQSRPNYDSGVVTDVNAESDASVRVLREKGEADLNC